MTIFFAINNTSETEVSLKCYFAFLETGILILQRHPENNNRMTYIGGYDELIELDKNKQLEKLL